MTFMQPTINHKAGGVSALVSIYSKSAVTFSAAENCRPGV